jgi:hypothetical protein
VQRNIDGQEKDKRNVTEGKINGYSHCFLETLRSKERARREYEKEQGQEE